MQRRSLFSPVAFELACLAIAAAYIPKPLMAQGPLAVENLSKALPSGSGAVGANNPWLGAQVAYRFGETSEFASNLLMSGQFVYPIDLGASPLVLPVIGNIGSLAQAPSESDNSEAIDDQAKQLLTSANGITLGLYPYVVVHQRDHLLTTLNFFAAWRVNALRPLSADSTSTDYIYLHQGKVGAGVELIVGARSDGSSPLTLDVTPTFTFFGKSVYKDAFGTSRSSFLSLEATAILPVQKGVGVVFEGVVSREDNRAFRVGLMLAGDPSK